MHKQIDYCEVLADISDIPLPELRQHLLSNYDLDEETIENIVKIVKFGEKHSKIEFSVITQNVAKKALDNFVPDKYLGMLFGGYKATDIISCTDKSIIYKGVPEPRTFNYHVAIKIITPTHMHIAGEDHLAMQVQYMANIEHNNIVDIKDFGVTADGIHFAIMEYLPGPNIAEYCVNNGLPLKERLKLFLQVSSGIAKMHVIPLIHADLKPQNIIMNVNNIPKIIDFDLSKSLSSKLHSGFNFRNIEGYTTLYAAPEQRDEKGNITILTDVYGLGQTLFEMLTGIAYANCSGSIDSVLKSYFRTFPRIKELSFVLAKALKARQGERHQNTNELMNDIKNIIHGDKISLSYQDDASAFYRLKHTYRKNRIPFWVSLVFIAFSIISVNSIINERNQARESLRLVIESNDPRSLNENEKLEGFALKALNKTLFTNEAHFQELIGWGDVFLGKGLNEKAELYFNKAKSLYPDIMSNEHIITTAKLVKSKSRQSNIKEIKQLIEPYMEILQSQQIDNPYLIKLYLETHELASIFVRNVFSEDDSFKLADSLNKLNLSKIRDPELQRELKLHILLRKGIAGYYSLPSDFVSVLSYITEEEEIQEVFNKLNETKDLFDEAISLIRYYNINTHLEPKIYAWLAHIESELKNYSLAEQYLDIAVAKSIAIFGENHYRTTQVYIKGFASFRYHDLKKALKYATKANNSFKNRINKSADYYFLTYELLATAYKNIGDLKSAIRTIEEMSNYYNQHNEGEGSYTLVYSSALFELWYFVHFNDPQIEKFYFEAAIIEPSYRQNFPDDISYRWDYYLMAIKNAQFEKAKKLHREYIDYILSEESNYDYDTRATELLSLASNCIIYKFCDTNELIPLVEQTMSWSATDETISVEKLMVYSQLANYYASIGRLVKAHKYLDEIKPILNRQVFENSIHISQYNKTKSIIEYKSGNYKMGEYFKNIALKGAIYNFGKDSNYVRSIKNIH